VPVTGIVVTKLDSTAKGGVVVAVHEALDLPIKFVGVGEAAGDLEAFDPRRSRASWSRPNVRADAASPAPAAPRA
jgi:signal recognition particle GTPase